MALLVGKLTSENLTLPRLDADTRDIVVRRMAECLAGQGLVPAEITTGVLVREEVESTGIGGGIAIPHVRVENLQVSHVCVASLAHPVEWNATDGGPVDLVFLLVGSRNLPGRQLRLLARISKLVGLDDFLAELRSATTPGEIVRAVETAETRHF